MGNYYIDYIKIFFTDFLPFAICRLLKDNKTRLGISMVNDIFVGYLLAHAKLIFMQLIMGGAKRGCSAARKLGRGSSRLMLYLFEKTT